MLAFINAGAAGSYGTVAEPGDDPQKFPNPQVYFYQARGFSLAESYYQSINVPYLGLMVAEPLAAPFAETGYGAWSTNLAPNSVLSGTSMLSVDFSARDGNHPLQQVDLFVDGKYFSTLTNLAPCPGNQLTVTLNGYPITYTVPTNSTVSTVASGLAALINAAYQRHPGEGSGSWRPYRTAIHRHQPYDRPFLRRQYHAYEHARPFVWRQLPARFFSTSDVPRRS